MSATAGNIFGCASKNMFNFQENEFSRERTEKEIVWEKPYNWKKHIIFELPDLAIFCIKVVFVVVVGSAVANAVIVGLSTVLIRDLPSFCEKLK